MRPNEHLAGKLRRLRLNSGLSQEAAGGCLQRTEISLLERGAGKPRLSTIVTLVRALEGAPSDLLTGIR